MTRFLPFGSRSKTIQVNTLGGGAPAVTYATWNPADKASDITLSSGNLLASQPNLHWSFVRSTIGKSSGKWYWESTVGTGSYNQIGVQDSAGNPDTDIAGVNPVGCSYNSADGGKVVNGTSGTYGSSFGNGDIIGTALDMDAGTIQFYKNGVAQPVITGLSGTQYAANSLYQNSTSLINFGATPFAYSVPVGYNEGLYDTVDLTAGLVAHYPLATNSLDTSGNGYDGVDTAITYSSGSAVFNGSSSFIDFGDQSAFDGMTDITMSVWVNPTTLGDYYFFTKDDVSNRSYTFDITNYAGNVGKLDALFFVGGNYSYAVTTNQNVVVPSTWQNVIVTRNASGIIKFYINGVDVGTTQINTEAGAINNSTATLQLGRRAYGPSPGYFNGNMKKARIYNRVLNAGEIAALYADA